MATQLAFDGLLETAAVTPVRRGGGVEERREPQACADAEANDGGQAEELITVEWPVRARVGVPVGRWVWDGDRIVAEYTREELGLALILAGKEEAGWALLRG